MEYELYVPASQFLISVLNAKSSLFSKKIVVPHTWIDKLLSVMQGKKDPLLDLSSKAVMDNVKLYITNLETV